MTKYRIVYWFNACTTECYIVTNSKENALKRFREIKGNKTIISIEECV